MTWRLAVLAPLLVAGCGRIGFDTVAGDATRGSMGDGGGGGKYDASLVMWLAMDDDPTDGVRDSAGISADGTCAPSGCPVLGAGRYGGGYVFDTTVWVQIAVGGPGLPTGDYTWSAWMRSPELVSYRGILVSRGVSASPGGFELDVQDGQVQLWANGVQTATGGVILDDTWTHVAATRASGTVSAFVDAVVVATDFQAVTHDFGACPLLVGVDNDSGCMGTLNGQLEGNLDEVRIYARALSQDEIAADMASPEPLPR